MNAGIDTDALRHEFLAESRELLERAEGVVLRLERSSDPAVVNELFRLVHTVKGNVGVLGEARLLRVAHELESLLNHVRNGRKTVDGALIDVVLTALDWLRRGIAADGSEPAQSDGIESQIRASMPSLDAPASTPAKAEGASASASQPRAVRARVPGRLIREAEQSGHEVVVALLDLSHQDDALLADFEKRCEAVRRDGFRLLCRLRVDEMPLLEEQNGGCLPAALIVAGRPPVAEALQRHGFRFSRAKIVFAPKQGGSDATGTTPTALVPRSSERNFPGLGAEGGDSNRAETGGAAPALGGSPEGATAAQQSEQLRVPLALIDRLIRLAGATVGARNELTQHIQTYEDPRLHLVGNRLGQMVTQLQEEIMRTRLQELRALFSRIPRVVRDVCRLKGKEATVSFEGEDVELDKNLTDAIGEAILHIVRNAVDHGIESPEERLRRGKPATGQIRIVAGMQSGNVTLSIRDDGAGLDLAALRAAAVRVNLMSAADAASLSDEEVADLIFAPGLSTAKTVSETSGRGVGMDVVRESFRRAGGSVTVTSVPGKGTHFYAMLPQTLSIVTCLTVLVGSDRYAIPQAVIDEMVRFDAQHLSRMSSQAVYRLRNRLLSLVDLGNLLYQIPVDTSQECFIAVVRSERHTFGMVVQQIGNPEEILVKPLGLHFDDVPAYAGAAVLGDGSVTAILDPGGIARLAGLQAEVEEVSTEQGDSGHAAGGSHLLFLAGGALYALPTDYRPRILRHAGAALETVLGRRVFHHEGRIVPIVFAGGVEGAGAPPFLVLLRHETACFALAADQIFGVEERLALQQADVFRESESSGQALVNGRTALVLHVPSISRRLERDGFRGGLVAQGDVVPQPRTEHVAPLQKAPEEALV